MQALAAGFVQGLVVLVADQEQVFGALAEGGDARIVYAQALRAQHAGDVGEQAGAVGAHQHDPGATGNRVEVELRDHPEVPQMARLGTPGGLQAGKLAAQGARQRRLDLLGQRRVPRVTGVTW